MNHEYLKVLDTVRLFFSEYIEDWFKIKHECFKWFERKRLKLLNHTNRQQYQHNKRLALGTLSLHLTGLLLFFFRSRQTYCCDSIETIFLSTYTHCNLQRTPPTWFHNNTMRNIIISTAAAQWSWIVILVLTK